MPYSLSNLTMLFPIACSLGVAVALTGGLVQRPRYDWIRSLLRSCVWQMFALSLVGLLFRFTVLHILWIPLVAVFAVMFLFWNRSVTRNSIMLALLAGDGAPARVELLSRYLQRQTHGYWRRLGQRLARSFSETGDWIIAAYRAGLIRGSRPLTAIGLLRFTGNREFLRTELRGATEQRRLHSRWLGRIVAASLSYLPLVLVGITLSPAIGGGLQRLLREFRTTHETWQTTWAFWVADSGVIYWFAAPLWLLILALYLLQSFPQLTRVAPLSWLCGRYYRAVTLRALAESVRAQPQLALACRAAGRAMPGFDWSSRLLNSATRIENGETVASALRKSRLVTRSQSDAIALCLDSDSLAWTLEDLGTSEMQRLNERLSIVVQVGVVVLVLISAAFALLFASAVFSTLSQWVQEM